MKNFKEHYLAEASLGKYASKKLNFIFNLDRTNKEYLLYVHNIDSEDNEEYDDLSLSKEKIVGVINEFESLPEPVKIYRVVSLIDGKLNKKNLGMFWSFDEHSVIQFAKNNLQGEGTVVKLTATIDKKYIDWQTSLDQYFQNEHENENEINIPEKNQSKIKLISTSKLS